MAAAISIDLSESTITAPDFFRELRQAMEIARDHNVVIKVDCWRAKITPDAGDPFNVGASRNRRTK